MYEKTMRAAWADMDFNAHMGNTAYLDHAANVRMLFFAEHGFPPSKFHQLKIGPVLREDKIKYFREINMLETFTVRLELSGAAENGSQFSMRNEFRREDGDIAAVVQSTGGWMNLAERKLIVPPSLLFEKIQLLRKTEDFAVLNSSVK